MAAEALLGFSETVISLDRVGDILHFFYARYFTGMNLLNSWNRSPNSWNRFYFCNFCNRCIILIIFSRINLVDKVLFEGVPGKVFEKLLVQNFERLRHVNIPEKRAAKVEFKSRADSDSQTVQKELQKLFRWLELTIRFKQSLFCFFFFRVFLEFA